MRQFFSIFLISALLAISSLALAASPNVTTTGLVPCEGPECQVCHVVELGQRIINFLVGIAAFIAIIIFVWAGFTMLTAAGNTTKITGAWRMFTNVIVGLVIVLAGWLIIDTVMKWAFQGTTDAEKGSPLYEEAKKWGFGPWNEIKCAVLPGYVPSVPGGPSLVTTPTPTPDGTASLGPADCSPDNIKVAASQGGYTLTDAEAKTFSCLSVPESGCRNNPPQARTPEGKVTSASGVFQIVFGSGDDKCHNLNLDICTRAAQGEGHPVTGNLNCYSAFYEGSPRAGREGVAAACKAAARNFACNASAAACLLRQDRGFSAWTSDKRSTKQRQCIATFNR